MDPVTIAGALAAAYGLGLIPKLNESTEHALLAGLAGFGLGRVSASSSPTAALEERYRREIAESHRRIDEAQERERLLREEFATRFKHTLEQAAKAHVQARHQ